MSSDRSKVRLLQRDARNSSPREANSVNINEESVAFKWQLGDAIATWVHIEHALIEVTLGIGPGEQPDALRPGLSGLESFRQKILFANAVLSSSTANPGHLAAWKILKGRCEAESTLGGLALQLLRGGPVTPGYRRRQQQCKV